MGRDDAAATHFDTAAALADKSCSPVWRARVLHDRARWRAARGDAAGAAEAAEAGLDDATAMGMPTVAARCRSILDAARSIAPPAATYPDALSAANHVRSILQKTGTANRAEAATYAARQGLLED
jgi:hypothetical protein